MINVAFHPLPELDMGVLHFFSVLGRALFTAQHLEMNCRGLAGFLKMREQVAHSGSSIIEDSTFQKKINQLWHMTLGQHVDNLARVDIFSQDFTPVLKDAVRARNEIAHEVAMGLTATVDSELDNRIAKIQILVRQIASADKVVAAMIHILNGDPLPGRGFIESYEDKVTAWVVEDIFED